MDWRSTPHLGNSQVWNTTPGNLEGISIFSGLLVKFKSHSFVFIFIFRGSTTLEFKIYDSAKRQKGLTIIEILYIEGTSGRWACPSSRQREKMSRMDPLCPIAHAACPARQRRMVQFIGSLTLEPAGYHGHAHLQRRLYLVPSMYNISMLTVRCDIHKRSRETQPSGEPFIPNEDEITKYKISLFLHWVI